MGSSPNRILMMSPTEEEMMDDREEPLCLNELRMACLISQPNLDFRTACSCDECGPKITLIKRFENEMKSKRNLIQNHSGEVHDKELMCSWICSAAEWTERMLYLLHKRLGQLSEEFGVPRTPEHSRSTIDACKKIMETLVDNSFFIKSDQYFSFQEICEYMDASLVSEEIDTGKVYYGRIKLKDSPNAIFKEIERIEEEQKVTPDPINNLEQQVALVKSLPIGELQLQTEEIVSQICPLHTHGDYFLKARQCINDTLDAMISISAEFWQHYQVSPPSQEHSCNKLDRTLDSLILKVKLFEDEWESEYASFFRDPYYRSDPKRQRTK